MFPTALRLGGASKYHLKSTKKSVPDPGPKAYSREQKTDARPQQPHATVTKQTCIPDKSKEGRHMADPPETIFLCDYFSTYFSRTELRGSADFSTSPSAS